MKSNLWVQFLPETVIYFIQMLLRKSLILFFLMTDIYIYIYIYKHTKIINHDGYRNKRMNLLGRFQILYEVVWMSLHNALGKIGTILFSYTKATNLGEGKTLNSKPEECYSGESVAHWWTIVLLLDYPRSVSSPRQTFTTINKSSV